MKTKPFLLISNDDGVSASGINALIDALRPHCELLVVAPDGPRSGKAFAMTSDRPVTIRLIRKERGLKIYSCSGTPVDCVKLAFAQLLGKRLPDLVVTGINHGDNSSINTLYSGTMGAAGEGVLHGVPAIGFSLCDLRPDADFAPLRPYLIDLTFKAITAGLPPLTCLNVNFPLANKFKGVRVCRMAHTTWINEFTRSRTPRGETVYWLTGDRIDDEPDADDTDSWALRNDYVAITPVTLDVTATALLPVLCDVF